MLALGVMLLLLGAVVLVLGVAVAMEDQFAWMAVLALAAVAAATVGIAWIHKGAYRQGQIDYAQGIVKYALIEQPDGQRIWAETRPAGGNP